jgi:hypothetical protein
VVGAGAGATRSTLRFSDDRELDISQLAVTASAGIARPSRFSARVSLGAVLDGSLEGEGRTYDVGPGFIVAASVAQQWISGDWFLTGTFSVAVSRTTTTESQPGASRETLIAVDVARGGVIAGRRFGPVAPYILARAFGGPVYWQLDAMDVSGTDVYHVQLGAGASVSTGSGFSVVLDVSALGEQAASLGIALRL